MAMILYCNLVQFLSPVFECLQHQSLAMRFMWNVLQSCPTISRWSILESLIHDSRGQAAKICAPPLQAAQVSFGDPRLQPGSVYLASFRVHSAPVSCYDSYLESEPVSMILYCNLVHFLSPVLECTQHKFLAMRFIWNLLLSCPMISRWSTLESL